MKKLNKKRQSLNSGWYYLNEENNEWQKATVPGFIHLDLLNNEEIQDPFFGKNELDLKWIEEKNWIYKLYFTPEDVIFNHENILIRFDGVDTYADIFINGKKILTTNNMFHPWFAEIKSYLRSSENELIVKFRSPINEVRSKMKSLNYELPAENDQAGNTSPHTRKAPYHYGWDWGPSFVSSGIWKDVTLLGYSGWYVENISIVNSDLYNGNAELLVEVNIFSNVEELIQIIISEPKTKTKEIFEIEIRKGNNALQQKILMIKPELWWPRGHGEQPLYNFTIKIESKTNIYEQVKRLGIRKVLINREADERGESFAIYVNNTPIFAKGANWIPGDSFTTRMTGKDYECLLDTAAKANMNMLRVWGGGIYEPDHFYELCDEIGIMVWQDFMFACSMYPADDKFLKSVDKEARYQVNRLKSYACIMLWCGNNEIASGWISWGWKEKLPDSVWKDYDILFHHLLPSICHELDPGRLYWPSSPGHSLILPKEDQIYGRGDNHYWGVWHGGDSFEAFEENVGRFMSEYGMQSLPSLNTIMTFANKEDLHIDSEVMNAHQKASLGTGNLIKYIEDHYTMNGNFESTVILSQIMQAQAIKSAVESHRRNMPFCMGTLYWQFNDCWPAISWSSIDYEGNWKALHYLAKRFFDSTLISLIEKDEMIDIYLVNDIKKEYSAQLFTRLYRFDGTLIFEKKMDIDVKSYSSDIILSLNKNELIGQDDPSEVFMKCDLLSNNKIISSNNYFFIKAKDLKIPKAKFEFDNKKINEKYLITIKAYSFIYQLHISAKNAKGIFSDNYFEMLPNEVVTIEFNPTELSDVKNGQIFYEIHTIYELMN